MVKYFLSFISVLSILMIWSTSATMAQGIVPITVAAGYAKGSGTFDIVVKNTPGNKLVLYVNDKSPSKATVNKKAWATFHKVKLSGTGKISFTRIVKGRHGTSQKPINYTRQYSVTNNRVTFAAPVKPACNGTTITANCTVEGVNYSTYIYHPAVPQKSHTETVTTYEKKVTGYCTLCVDRTYSPSCATGRGACSWHGGVAEWNAPEYSSVPVNSTKTVIDTPAQAAYYEKVAE